MNRRDILEIFNDKSVDYVFSRIKQAQGGESGKYIQVLGSQLEEEENFSRRDSMTLEYLLNAEFVLKYRYLLDLGYETSFTVEERLIEFSRMMYSWNSDAVGFVPDWYRDDIDVVLNDILRHQLNVRGAYLSDSEYLALILFSNTQYDKLPNMKECIQKGMQEASTLVSAQLYQSEKMFKEGKLNKEQDSVSLINRMCELGYRSLIWWDTWLRSEDVQDTIVIRDGKTEKGIMKAVLEYGETVNWISYVDELIQQFKTLDLKNITLVRCGYSVVEVARGDKVVGISFGNNVSIYILYRGIIEVIYNAPYYATDSVILYEKVKRAENRIGDIAVVFGIMLRHINTEVVKFKLKEGGGNTWSG